MEDETGTKAIPMASDIKTSQLCYLICACIRHYFPRRQGNRSGPQLASLRHGRLTPARISPGCPPCLRLGLGRSIIIPGRVIAKQPATGCFVDGWTRSAPYLAVIDAGFICTGGLGASSSVACPGQGAPSGRYPDDWIFDFQRTREEPPSLYYPLSEGAENQNFMFL